MILVLGATGTNGREVFNRLAARSLPVRALVRNPAKAADLRGENVEIVAGDLENPESLDAALAGVDHVFFVASVDRRYNTWFNNFLEAAKRAGTPHIVKFSGLGAATDSRNEIMRDHGETDKALISSGLPWTILQPNSFHQNMFWSAATIKDHGAFYLPLGDAHQSVVDVRDIASVAVRALTEAGHEGKLYEITGPESPTYHEIAAQLSEALGKPVRYVPVTAEAALDSMLKSGMPEWNAHALTQLYKDFAAGLTAQVTDTVERVTGEPAIPFLQFARENVAAFR